MDIAMELLEWAEWIIDIQLIYEIKDPASVGFFYGVDSVSVSERLR